VNLLIGAYLERLGKLLQRRNVDLLWLEKELLPWVPASIDALLAPRRIPVVVDYDDAVFHRYDSHDNALVRLLLGKKIRRVMKRASTVVVGNDYLSNYAHQAGARRIETLPSVVDTARYFHLEKPPGTFRIGWIGSPITAPYLALIRQALEAVLQATGGSLVVIGAGSTDPLPGMNKELHPWSLETEVSLIQSMDVGIMPLPDGPFERGKCGYKIIQYMACGLPVVASPVGVNAAILEQGTMGFLASTAEEWERALLTLAGDSALRSACGQAGRARVEQHFNLQTTAPRLVEILKTAARRTE